MLTVLERTGSVLDDAWKMVAENRLDEFDAVLAREQSAGRGQYGRTWLGGRGNVYCAIRLPFVSPFDNMEAALAVSCCIAATLSELGFEANIKWMNDLVINGAKVAGILLEQKGERLVAGIGINLKVAPEAFELRDDAAVKATSLAMVNAQQASRLTPEMVVDKLVNHLKSLDLGQFSRQWRREAEKRLLWKNEEVVLDVDGVSIKGVLVGVGPHGELVLANEAGIGIHMRGSLKKTE